MPLKWRFPAAVQVATHWFPSLCPLPLPSNTHPLHLLPHPCPPPRSPPLASADAAAWANALPPLRPDVRAWARAVALAVAPCRSLRWESAGGRGGGGEDGCWVGAVGLALEQMVEAWPKVR